MSYVSPGLAVFWGLEGFSPHHTHVSSRERHSESFLLWRGSVAVSGCCRSTMPVTRWRLSIAENYHQGPARICCPQSLSHSRNAHAIWETRRCGSPSRRPGSPCRSCARCSRQPGHSSASPAASLLGGRTALHLLTHWSLARIPAHACVLSIAQRSALLFHSRPRPQPAAKGLQPRGHHIACAAKAEQGLQVTDAVSAYIPPKRQPVA